MPSRASKAAAPASLPAREAVWERVRDCANSDRPALMATTGFLRVRERAANACHPCKSVKPSMCRPSAVTRSSASSSKPIAAWLSWAWLPAVAK